MFWGSFIVALAAAFCFLAEAAGYAGKRARLLPLGLFLLTAAWILQLLVASGTHWTV